MLVKVLTTGMVNNCFTTISKTLIAFMECLSYLVGMLGTARRHGTILGTRNDRSADHQTGSSHVLPDGAESRCPRSALVGSSPPDVPRPALWHADLSRLGGSHQRARARPHRAHDRRARGLVVPRPIRR